MPGVMNTEWLNENSLRAYPIRENLQRYPNSDGTLLTDAQLPNFVLVDLVLTLPSTVVGGTEILQDAYISQIAYVGNLFTVVLKDDADVQIAIVTVDLTTHVKNDAYDIFGSDTYEDARGRIVIGDMSAIADSLAEGLYDYTIDQTELEPSTVRPSIRGVRSLQVVNAGDESEYIDGRVKLVAGSNIRFRYDATENAIWVDGIDGEGFEEECDCANEVGQRNIVRTINGVPVEDAIIVGDGRCVTVDTSGNTITISDSCSAPCCDCPELEFITESLKVLEATVDRLEAYADELSTRTQQFIQNFILTIL